MEYKKSPKANLGRMYELYCQSKEANSPLRFGGPPQFSVESYVELGS
jgi:hypothetical protein